MTTLVVGATTWGLTLASLLQRNGSNITVLCRDPAEAARLALERGLARAPGLHLDRAIAFTHPADLPAVDGVVVVIPVQRMRTFLAGVDLPRDVPVLSASKGLEHGSNNRPSQILQTLGFERVSALSGPNLAAEVIKGLPAASVAASSTETDAARWQRDLSGPLFRVYTSADIVGVELAGALKNVVAIAAGASDGLGFGHNTMAALITRGLAEITRLGVALGADAATFLGLAGVGDLVATCTSPLSRNYRLGNAIARGQSLEAALASIPGIAEGAETAPVAVTLAASRGLDVPIAEQVDAVLNGRASVTSALAALFGRPLKAELS